MFQKVVYSQNSPAVAGDFCSSNPRAMALAGPGGLVAGAAGLTVGRFAWGSAAPVDDNGSPTTVTNAGAGAPHGFVHREQQALITTYLAESSNVVPGGFPVEIMTHGDVWVLNTGAAANVVGNKAFASNTTGQVQFGAAGATIAGYTETKWYARSVGAANELVKISDIA